MSKYTNSELLESAKLFQVKEEWRKAYPKHYAAAWYRKLLEACCGHMEDRQGLKSGSVRVSDNELKIDAAKFQSRSEWTEKSPNLAFMAKRRGKVFFQECCQHMADQRGLKSKGAGFKYSVEELIESAKPFKHPGQWRNEDYNRWQSAYARPEVYKEATAHMTPAASPYAGDYVIYVFEFTDRHFYVGLTFRFDDRIGGHSAHGPVFDHTQACPEYEIKKVEVDIKTPAEAALAEARWEAQYVQQGWTKLNKAKTGGLGGVSIAWTKDACIYSASLHETRTAWLKAEQYAYKAAKKNGWFEEAVAHMLTAGQSQQLRKGERRIDEAKLKMSLAKKGVMLSEEHKKAIGHSLQMLPNRAEVNARISRGCLGVPKSEEHRYAISEGKKGMVFSESHRRAISESLTGKSRHPYKERVDKGTWHLSQEEWEMISTIRRTGGDECLLEFTAFPCEVKLDEDEIVAIRNYRSGLVYQRNKEALLPKLHAKREEVREAKWRAMGQDGPPPKRISKASHLTTRQYMDFRSKNGGLLRKLRCEGDVAVKAELEAKLVALKQEYGMARA